MQAKILRKTRGGSQVWAEKTVSPKGNRRPPNVFKSQEWVVLSNTG